MIYYFLPGGGIFGGVKVACRFVELLGALGAPAVCVLPDGRAPDWFACGAPVVSEAEAERRITDRDWLMITWPPDHLRLKAWPGRLVCHVQGTDTRMSALFADPDVVLLTCWDHATTTARAFGREPIEVGLSLPDLFVFDGRRKHDTRVAYMPRRGFPLVRACLGACRHLDFAPLDGLTERQVAERLKAAGLYLATSVDEDFGLPALEAMAAGCVVVSVPVTGGAEYLIDGHNAFVVEPDQLATRLRWIADAARADLRCRIRHRAVATALAYRPVLQRRRVERLLQHELRELRA